MAQQLACLGRTTPHALTTDALIKQLAGRVYAGRELVRRQRASAETILSTSIPGLDALIGGGLERGATLELVGRASSGRFSLLLAMLAAVTSCGEPAALIDRGSMLDPRAAAAAGIDLPRLLWVRPQDMRETLTSAEIVLETGMPLVVVDLGLPPLEGGRGAEAAWLRLARAARTRRTALIIGAPYRVSGTAAGTVIETHKSRTRWHPPTGHPGRLAPRLLHGLATRLTLVKRVARTKRPPGSNTLRDSTPRPVRPGDQEAYHLTVEEAIPDVRQNTVRGTGAHTKTGAHAVA